MPTQMDLRQSVLRSALGMVGSAANDTADTILPKIDAELAKLFEDRNIQLTDGGLVSFLGTSVQFTQSLKLHVNSRVAGGSPVIIDLAATTRNVSADGRMIYAVINRTAGTATVTDDATTLPAVTSANQEVFLIAKRVDSPDGVKRLYFRNGSAFNEGQSARLGSAGSGSGSGSGVGDDLDNLTFKADVSDTFAELSTDTTTTIDYGTNKTQAANLSVVNQLIRLSYDAAKTATVYYTFTVTSANATAGATYTNNGITFTVVTTIAAGTTLVCTANGFPVATSGVLTKATGTGDATITFSTYTNVTMKVSAAPAYTVAIGDMVVNQTTLEVRRITALGSINTDGGSGTPFTIESGFTTNLNALAVTVSQAAYTKDLNAYAGDGIAPSTAFSTSINQIMVMYEDTTTSGDTIFDANTTPVIGFSASSDGSSYSTLQTRPTNLSDSWSITNLPTSSTNLYIRFVANKTSGSGAVNILGYKAFFHRDQQFQDGMIVQQAYGLTSGAGSPVNMSIGSSYVVAGKSRAVTSWSYPVGVNSGTTNGALSVYLNGQKIPRFVSSTITPDAYYTEIDQKTIELDQDYSGNNYSLEVVLDQAVVDITDSNITAINQIQAASTSGFQGFVDQSQLMIATTVTGSPAAGTFYSSIFNRAPIPDLSADLKPRMGVERIMTQGSLQIQNEFGPNGESVYSVLNDTYGQIRCVGLGWTNGFSNVSGTGIYSAANGDYVEVTFYGTGLNAVAYVVNVRNFQYAVDGGGLSANLVPATVSSAVDSRNTSMNTIIPVVSGLPLGIHTVKLQASTANGATFFGFEILNESSSLKIQPGTSYVSGKKYVLNSQQTVSYNSSFETGSLNTRSGNSTGGRVLVYQKTDGTVAKSLQNVPGSAPNYFTGSVDHSNEDVARTYHWREFGAGRTDDFSSLVNSASNKAFTLDDGTTSLNGSNVLDGSPVSVPTVEATGAGAFVSMTFVGTGLDVIYSNNANTRNTDISIDGVSIGTLSLPATSVLHKQAKIASGLPYGTHTVKFLRNTLDTIFIEQLVVYQPKKPTLPAGAIELADYNIMADFVNDTAGPASAQDVGVSSGTLYKSPMREVLYVGTWTASAINTTWITGFSTQSTTNTDYLELTFFGTGIEHRTWYGSTSTYSITYLIDGIALNTGANTGSTVSIHSSQLGSMAVSAAGVVSGTSGAGSGYGSKIRISGLPLGKHTLRITRNSITGGDANLYVSGFNIITPLHSYKSNVYADIQNTLPVGSNSISDNRKITPIKDALPVTKAWAQAIGITSGPSTTSTSMIPMPDMSCTIKTTGGPLDILFEGVFDHGTANGAAQWQIYVDGIAVTTLRDINLPTAGDEMQGMTSIIVPVSAGTHRVDVYWDTNTGTLSGRTTQRILKIREL